MKIGMSLCRVCDKAVYVEDLCRTCFKKHYEEGVYKQTKRFDKVKLLKSDEPAASIAKQFLANKVDKNGTPVMPATLEEINFYLVRKKLLGKKMKEISFFSVGPSLHAAGYAKIKGYSVKKKNKDATELFLERLFTLQPQVVHGLNKSLQELE